MKSKKAQLNLSVGLLTRLVGGFMNVLSLPFIITNPNNIVAWIFFSFGSGLITVGGLLN